MDGSQPQSRVDLELNCDYISNLPADVKEKILMELPIKEAVRTSILSSKWKDSWASIPNLVFEEKCAESRLIKLVDKVLLHHHGSILEFKLVSKHSCNEAIGGWMLVLSRNGIQNLELTFDGDERCEIPSRFFSCVALKCYLAMGPIPEKLPIILNRLKKIDVHLYNSDHDKIATALCLLRSAPNLKVLYIQFFDWGGDQQPVQTLWESEATKGRLFKCLEIVNIIYVAQSDKPMSPQISQSMLEFAKLVLSTAPVLKKLNICRWEDDVAFGKKLESFPKLSKKAEVVFVKEYGREFLE